MNAPMPLYLLLSLVDHQLVALEVERHGSTPSTYARCLNSAGRWAIHGSTHSPLLVWEVERASEARAAAERSTKSRGRLVEVISRHDSRWRVGHNIEVFSAGLEPALHGYAAQSAAKARRLRTETDKLEAFCVVVHAASTARDHATFADVSRKASKALHARFGGGSITSVFAWLAGRAGRSALESVLAGEVELSGPLTLAQIVQAAKVAQDAERLREQGATPDDANGSHQV